jgi:hypothetical protein
MSPRISFTEEFLRNFDQISEFLVESEQIILEEIASDLPEVEPLKLESEDLVTAVFIPQLESPNIQNSSRAYCLSALIFLLRNDKDDFKELKESNDRNAKMILEMVSKVKSASQEFDIVNGHYLAYYCYPNEFDTQRSEIVFNRIPEDYLPKASGRLRRPMKPLFDSRKISGDSDYFGTVSHELTHFYINTEIEESGFNLKTLQDQKPYIVSVDEAAAFAISSLHSEQNASGSYYRKRDNAPASVLENCAESFLKMTEGMNMKERKQKIRETASEMIVKAASGENSSAVKDFIDGTLDKKIKSFNVDKEKANKYITHALIIIGVIEESPFPDSRNISFKNHIKQIKESMTELEELAQENPELEKLHQDLKETLNQLESDEKDFYQDYDSLKQLDSNNNLYQTAYVDNLDYEAEIPEKSRQYLEIINDLENGLNETLQLLKRLHHDEEQEAQVLQEHREREGIKSIISQTEKAYKEIEQALKDLEKAKDLMEKHQ